MALLARVVTTLTGPALLMSGYAQIARTKNINNVLMSQGADAIVSTPDEFRVRLQTDIAKWTATVKAAGLHAE